VTNYRCDELETTPIAHIRLDKNGNHIIHSLLEHLQGTAEKARQFASPFDSGDWAYLAGLWHDLGKYSNEFQSYIRLQNGIEAHIESEKGRIDHSTAGAQYAVGKIDLLGHLLSYVIAGHHSGLLDGRSEFNCQEDRLNKRVLAWTGAPSTIVQANVPLKPAFLYRALGKKDAFSISFFVRMIFSCLVDADFLDTEQFMNPDAAYLRSSFPGNVLNLMEQALNEFVTGLSEDDAPVNSLRTYVRQACLNEASKPLGFFSLTVPTGGGKTLSSLAFALRHAQIHGLNRIVYVVPFTTIIEQNAEEFRKPMTLIPEISYDRLIVEHHSNFDPHKETAYSRLACENWDAPLIITTSVQFYESLFNRRASACRKLHNLAKAAIILDEAQNIPVEYLEPCLKALNELTTNYGSTVVLCTATQPAVHKRPNFSIGIENVKEIVPDPPRLYQSLKRVQVEFLGLQTDLDLVSSLKNERQILCVVNTRGHARSLMEAMGNNEGNFHLSASMCPAHRTETLNEIRRRLESGLSCRVVSTQLIEAGVNVDFPIVFRSMAGLDSIAQAAGRCNRNGRLTEKGKVFIFRSEHRDQERFLSDKTNCAAQIIDHKMGDLLELEIIEQYFKLYYWDQSGRWDEKNILQSFGLAQDKDFPFLFNFRTASRDFQIIAENTKPVIIPWDAEGKALCEKLRILPGLNREIARQLQRYAVQIHMKAWTDQLNRTIKSIFEGSMGVLMSVQHNYSEIYGLHINDSTGNAIFV